jgi:hypothetical protein
MRSPRLSLRCQSASRIQGWQPSTTNSLIAGINQLSDFCYPAITNTPLPTGIELNALVTAGNRYDRINAIEHNDHGTTFTSRDNNEGL